MADIELYVHTHEGVEPKVLKIASDATVEQLIGEMRAAGAAVGESGDEIVLWVENEEKKFHKGHKIHEHGIKHRHHLHCNCMIVVNTREKKWDKKEICFVDVVKLAFGSFSDDPNVVYTVTYSKGPRHHRDGSLVKGKCVEVKCGMIFNVTQTNKG